MLALHPNTIGQIIEFPDLFVRFSRVLERADLSPQTATVLHRISADQWQDLIETANADPSFRNTVMARWQSGTLASIPLQEAPDTLLDKIKRILGDTGAVAALVIAIVVLVAAALAMLMAAIAIAAAPAAAAAGVLAVAVIGFIITVLYYLAALGGTVAAIIGMIAVFLPSRIIHTDGVDMVGGTGGSIFFDDVSGGAAIKKIKIRHGAAVDAVEIVWTSSQSGGEKSSGRHGGSGGGETIIVFKPGEYITELRGRSGYMIDQLEIHTNLDRYGPFGGNGGSPFAMKPQYGTRIIGFHGRSGERIDAIGGMTEIYGSTQAGGMGGIPFLDEIPAHGRLSRIDIWSGEYIDAIQVTHEIDGVARAGGRHGGNGGSRITIDIGTDETITRVWGRNGVYVDSINFELTKADGTSRILTRGGKGGHEAFDLLKIPGKKITGFWGRSGAYIDAIGICTT